MRNPVNPINFSLHSSGLDSPGFEGLSDFEVDNLRSLRKAAGSIALTPTQVELQAHRDEIAARNYEFVSSIPEILPSVTLTPDTSREPAGEFNYGAKLVLRNLCYEFVSQNTNPVNQGLAEELSALRTGLVWLDVRLDTVVSAHKTRNQHDTYFTTNLREVSAPYLVVGAHSVDDGYADVAFLSANTLSSRFDDGSNVSSTPFFKGDIFNDRWTSLKDTLSLFAKRSMIIARMREKQLHNLEALQSVMLGEGLSQEELVGIRRDDKLVISPETAPVFRAKNRLPRLLRFYKGPENLKAIESHAFSIDIVNELEGAIPAEMFNEFSMMRWIHRAAVFFNKEDEFAARVKKYTERLPEDPTEKYIRENS